MNDSERAELKAFKPKCGLCTQMKIIVLKVGVMWMVCERCDRNA